MFEKELRCVLSSAATIDYNSTSEIIEVFSSDDTRHCVDIPILDNEAVGESVEFNVVLESTDPNVIVTTPEARVVIEDDDGKLELGISLVLFSVGKWSITFCYSR